MNHYLSLEETAACNSIQAELKTATAALDRAFLKLAQSNVVCDWPPEFVNKFRNAIQDAECAIRSIDLHPQSEWAGRDSLDPTNFKTRRPDGLRKWIP